MMLVCVRLSGKSDEWKIDEYYFIMFICVR